MKIIPKEEPISEVERCTTMIKQLKDNPTLKSVVYKLSRKLEELTSSQEH